VKSGSGAFFGFFLMFAYGVLLFLETKKVGKKVSRWPRGAWMMFSVFMGGGHPYQPAQFPPFRVCHTPLLHTPNTSTPTAQRPTPPANRILILK